MALIKINITQVQSVNNILKSNVSNIDNIKHKVNSLRNNVDSQLLSMRNCNYRLINTYNNLNNIQNKLNDVYQTIEQSAQAYDTAESKLAKSDASNVLKNNGDIIGAFLSGSILGRGTIFGIGLSAKAEGELIGGSVKTKNKAEFDLEKGNVEIKEEVEAEGHIAKGKVSGNFGVLNGSIEGTIGSVSATGTIGATLFSNGKFTPSLTAKLETEAVVAKGEENLEIGNDDFNAHEKATGELLGAKAEVSAGIGKVSYKDDNGNITTGFGVTGKVGAEAYVAQGEISGGFTVFGIKIDLGAEGKAGGVGVHAGGAITTGGVNGSIGAGLGLGAGLSINIDWSDFKL